MFNVTLTTPSQPETLSVADALRAVVGWSDLPPQQRRNAASALAKIVEQDGRPAGAIPLTPAVVRKAILVRSAGVLGVTVGRKYNIHSEIGQVMHRLGLIASKTPLSLAWTALLAPLDRHERATLTALARWASAHQIAPADVDAAALAGLREHLETRTLTPRPSKVAGAARTAWNRYARTIADWPGQMLPDPRPVPPVLPAAFHADRDRFCARSQGGAIAKATFQRPTPLPPGQAPLQTLARGLRASTIALHASYCDWAAYTLVATGFPAAAITSLAVLLDNAGAIVGRLHQDAGEQPSARAMHVANMLRIIARYDANWSDQDMKWLKDMANLVKLPYRSITEKNDRCARAALEPQRDEWLLALPAALMEAAHANRADDPKKAAGLAWRAVVIEILTVIPLRLGNIIGLRLDQHLYRPDPRRGRITALMIPPEQTKNSRPIQAPVSPTLAAMLDTWINQFRPLLADPACVYLFPGCGAANASLTPQAVRDAVKQVTGQSVGVVLSPHQFRHLAARRFLQDNDGQYEALSRILGHASAATSRRSYAPAEDTPSQQRYDDMIARKRARLQRQPKRPPPTPRRPSLRRGQVT